MSKKEAEKEARRIIKYTNQLSKIYAFKANSKWGEIEDISESPFNKCYMLYIDIKAIGKITMVRELPSIIKLFCYYHKLTIFTENLQIWEKKLE